MSSLQNHYPDQLSHCYGCGRLNTQGLHVESYWDGEESICTFQPKSYHIAVPGYVYGGLIASLIDCHSTGTAAAAAYRAEGGEMGSDPPLELRSTAKAIDGRKVVVVTTLSSKGEHRAKGEVVAVRMPESMVRESAMA